MRHASAAVASHEKNCLRRSSHSSSSPHHHLPANLHPMASLIRTALPRLTHALPKSTLSHFKAPSPSVIRQYSVKHSSNSSPFPSILAKLSAIPKNASTSRSISTTYGSANPQVDWTRVAVGMGVAAVGVVGLNYALNRETRGGLTAFESS